MSFIFKKARIYGVEYGSCGIRKEDNVPEVPDIPSHDLNQIVDKASSEPEWKPIHRAADDNAQGMADDISKVTDQTKENIDKKKMEDGIKSKDVGLIYSAIPWALYNKGLNDLRKNIGVALNQAGNGMVKTLPKDQQFKFENNTQRAIKWIDKQGARLVVEVGKETRDAIKKEISKALKEGLGSDRTANNIINLVGLTNRQAGAVTNFRKSLIATGVSDLKVEKEVSKYAKRLHEYRAGNIARTELMNGANQGHIEMLRQGVDLGIIPKDFYKVWIVTPDDRLCKYCKPMEGQKKKLDEEFVSSSGNVDRPPLHPQCRCVMGVEFENKK